MYKSRHKFLTTTESVQDGSDGGEPASVGRLLRLQVGPVHRRPMHAATSHRHLLALARRLRQRQQTGLLAAQELARLKLGH